MTGTSDRGLGGVRDVLGGAPMSRIQIIAVALAVALNALDGFDVLAVTFAAPGISRDWHVAPAMLGVAISSGLAGMAAGSLFLAPLGDRIGRRPLILVCISLMALGMLLTATARDIAELCAWRVVTGIGIGGMLAAINAVAAEFANERRRDLCVALMAVGYPIGGLIGGFAVAELVAVHGWRAIFVFGGALTAAFIPLVWLGLPESLEHLQRQRRPEALRKLNALLARMGHLPLPASPQATSSGEMPGGLRALLGSGYRRLTLFLVLAYFLHIMTFYLCTGWLPKLIVDMGYAAPDAIRVSAIMSLGGVLGGAALGWAAPALGLRPLVIAAMIGTSFTMAILASLQSLTQIQIGAAATGVCLFGGIVGLYAALARAFPARMRVTGTGLAIGLGRGGAVIGPILGGLLIEAGLRTGTVLGVMGLFALAAAAAFALVPPAPEQTSTAVQR